MQPREALILGALLHDIGKFSQRTGLPPSGYEEFGPEDYGKNGAHSKWSASFISQFVPEKWHDSAGLAFYHHNPQDEKQKLIACADALSAGIDRERRLGAERGDTEFDRQGVVLEQVYVPSNKDDKRVEKKREFSYEIKSLSLEKRDLFPQKIPRINLKEEYRSLWEEFLDEVRLLPTANLDSYLESLYFLLEKYTWCIPSATYMDYPDIPLFDHLKTTAAIVACLYETGGEDEFLFIEGDLSGIQDFIYGAPSPSEAQSGMAKRLRGKSFYLSLLTGTLCTYFLREIDLPTMNALWCGGGHFAILAPNVESTAEKLRKAKQAAESFLWDNLRGDISLLVGQLETDGKGLKNFSVLIDEMGYGLSELKMKKQRQLFRDKSKWQFKFEGEVCPLCERDAERLEQDEEGRLLCSQCLKFEEIGQRIPRTMRLVRFRHHGELVGEEAKGAISFGNLGISCILDESGREEPPPGASEIEYLSVVDNRNTRFCFLPESAESKAGSYGFEILANTVAMDNQKIVEFDALADRSKGADFLGVLRMDVDNFGAVLSIGLDEKDRSISRIASLSRTINLFFSGFLNQLAEGKNLYVTYAGGDDLFVVGAWNEIVDLASAIRCEFTEYCCRNPHLHLSGGIYLCKGRFPIGRAAEYAGERLDGLAKKGEKNALVFLEQRVPWDEFEKVKRLADEKIIPTLKDDQLSRRFIYFLLRLYRQHIDPKRLSSRSGRSEELIWVPKLLYNLARNVKDKKLQVDLQGEVMRLRKYLPVLAGYVSLKTRS